MTVTVYTRDGCTQCRFVKNFLTSLNVPFDEVNIQRHPEAIDALKDQGFLAVPVTVFSEAEKVVGFAPDRLKKGAQRNVKHS